MSGVFSIEPCRRFLDSGEMCISPLQAHNGHPLPCAAHYGGRYYATAESIRAAPLRFYRRDEPPELPMVREARWHKERMHWPGGWPRWTLWAQDGWGTGEQWTRQQMTPTLRVSDRRLSRRLKKRLQKDAAGAWP